MNIFSVYYLPNQILKFNTLYNNDSDSIRRFSEDLAIIHYKSQ